MARFAICQERCQTREEEIVNSITHGLGLVLALVAAPILIYQASGRGDTGVVVGVTVFAVSALLLYLASTVYHAWPPCPAKETLRRIEHAAIFVLIAGTYTPFGLGALRGAWGFGLLALVWSVAAGGILLSLLARGNHDRLKLLLYLGMGWLVVIAIYPLWQAIGTSSVLWLLAGGLAYTVGVLFFLAEQIRYAHGVWHLFVVAGTCCHGVAVQAL